MQNAACTEPHFCFKNKIFAYFYAQSFLIDKRKQIMATLNKKDIPQILQNEFLNLLKIRFEKNMNRHEGVKWNEIETKLKASQKKLGVLYKMEETGGEPDVIEYDKKTNEFIFCDCSEESPKNRRSLCYDQEALASRKEHKPKNSAMGMALEMGIELLTEEQYRKLQQLGKFDTKTSSWLKTPSEIRKLGGAIFGDYRYGNVFIYHNGAESYYSSRGFRGLLKI
ncbi:MAG: hypothetical protein HJHJAOHD_01842 [Flavobacteriales bacterium]|nr:hypothetical protein [Flavobacteriales bacterium]